MRAHPGQVLAVIRHNARVLLSCERVILNLLQHLSGIATLTRKYADAIQGTHARVLDTRKTVPGMRALEKYAVLCGGGTNHRIDLASGILIKNNHIALGGGIAAVLKRALEQRKPAQRVQVEVRTPRELEEALAHGAEAILLDNMSPAEVRRSVERIKAARQPASPVAGFPLKPPAASCSTIFAPTPRPASTSSAWARSPTPPAPPTSPCPSSRSRLIRVLSWTSITAFQSPNSIVILSDGTLSPHGGRKGEGVEGPAVVFRRVTCTSRERRGTHVRSRRPRIRSRRHPLRRQAPLLPHHRLHQHRRPGRRAQRRGAPHGSVYFADEQTAGRGRGDHGWLSAAGEGLYVSVLLRLPIRRVACALLPLAAGLAAAERHPRRHRPRMSTCAGPTIS